MPFSLFVLRRQNVPFETFIALDFSGAGQAKSFRCRTIGLNFWHWILLYFNELDSKASLRSQQHRHISPFETRLDIHFGHVLDLIHHAPEHLPT
jgi:hypothetical protein